MGKPFVRNQLFGIVLLGMLFMAGFTCHHPSPANATPMVRKNDAEPFPYSPFRGLYDRANGDIVNAPAEDVELALSYPSFKEKGPLQGGGRRLTLLVQDRVYGIGEEIHILHFLEETQPGAELYIMGPKPVYGEYLDGQLQGGAPPPLDYPWMTVYDGEVLSSPELDYNFEISRYRFESPGQHRVQWKIGDAVSNTLLITVK